MDRRCQTREATVNENDRCSLSASFVIEITAVYMSVWHSCFFHDPLAEATPMYPVLEWAQWTNLLPVVTWFAALITALRHKTSYASRPMMIGIPLKDILHTCGGVGKATYIARESLNLCHRSYESVSYTINNQDNACRRFESCHPGDQAILHK